MIKIIKKGTRKEIECPTCGCLFSYEQEDIQDNYEYINGVGACQSKETYVKCPQCQNDVGLKVVNVR